MGIRGAPHRISIDWLNGVFCSRTHLLILRGRCHRTRRLLTGRLPFEHKADWWDPLDRTYPTLAEVLAKRGYRTAAFAANTSYVAPEWGLARGFSHFEVYGSSLADDVVRTVYGRKLALNILPRLGYFDIPGRKRASQVNEEFFRWLDGADGRPFFVMLNYFDLHDPYLTIDSYCSQNFLMR